MDVQPTPQPALHLLHGWWVASCPDCGYELAQRRNQEKAEWAADRRRCPVCRPSARDAIAAPPARGAGGAT